MGEEELYIGYLPVAPPGTARFLRRLAPVLLLFFALAAGALAALQKPFAAATFEYGRERSFEGTLSLSPHPVLWTGEPARALLLVAPGKHGAAPLLAGEDGRRLRVTGSLIAGGGLEMLEIVPEKTVSVGDGASAPPAAARLGRHRLRGEIVDGKCHLGVMKPGSDKPHKACAILCLRGGAPPLLVVRDGGGIVLQLLLANERGETFGPEILDFVAEPVEIEGEVMRQGGLLQLRAPAGSIGRL